MKRIPVKEMSADDMAKAMWEGYMKATDPTKRRWYAFRYEFWVARCDSDNSGYNGHLLPSWEATMAVEQMLRGTLRVLEKDLAEQQMNLASLKLTIREREQHVEFLKEQVALIKSQIDRCCK